jgi:hypothetical protein
MYANITLFKMKFFRNLIILICLYLVPQDNIYAQINQNPGPEIVYFLSDCQQPLAIEKILLHPYKNTEGRDSLFRDIEKHSPANIFLLGDLGSKGSSAKKWEAVDAFLDVLKRENSRIYAIPGNHEYLPSAKKGKRNYLKRFPLESLYGYCVTVDSVAIVMLNSNFNKLSEAGNGKQIKFYLNLMDSLDKCPTVLTIVVCAHHAPFSNSKIVGSSEVVQKAFVSRFMDSPKASLFITGHSHNLEYFNIKNKHFLVIGGGGGLAQPLYKGVAQKYQDLLPEESKPLFFYITLQRMNRVLNLRATGLKKEFRGIVSTGIAEIRF